MDNLKPCPFCGAEAIAFPCAGKYYVKCVACQVETRRDTRDEAASDWNRRAQPANDPITLDELRGMHREPVWCVSLDADGNVGPCWCHLVEWRDGNPFRDWIPPLDKYGKTWLAYRRRPESEVGA